MNKRSLLFLAGLFASGLSAQKPATIWAVDFVKTKSAHRAETLFYYEKNWKVYRDTALSRGYISGYRLLESPPDSTGNIDLVLMTAYPDSAAYANSEKHFQPIIQTLRFGGPYLMNQLKPADFRDNVFFKDFRPVFEAERKQTSSVVPAAGPNTFLKEIDRDIWIPFSEAYASNDAPKYLSLHSADFIRAEGGDQKIKSLSEYGEGVKTGFQRGKELGGQTKIEFRFFERFSNGVSASERGIYKYTYAAPEATPWVGYGRFHVISRKENGRWKILVDYDSNERNTIDDRDFRAAKPASEW